MPQENHFSWTARFIVCLCFTMGFATAAKAAPGAARSATALAAQTTAPFALADFDGDSQLDIATVQVGQLGSSDTRYWIDFHLSTGLRRLIGVTAPAGGLHIASRDVNGDNFLDLVVTSAWQRRPVAVLLNDGRGNFTPRDPAAFPAGTEDARTPSASAFSRHCDFAAAMLPRNSFGQYAAMRGIAPPRCQGRPFFRSACCQRAFSGVESVLGRAPPFRILHV